LNLIKEDREISIFGDGSNIRDYIFIDDLINITLQLYAKSTKYSVYNVGSGISASINTVVNILKEVSKKNINVKYLPERDVDVRNISMDISRISNELGLKDITELRNGIQKTWNWINKK
jgi:UDP-glucose 4-epimerase